MDKEITNQSAVSQLECHFKWFNELDILSNGYWLSGLLNKKLHRDLRSELEKNAEPCSHNGDPKVIDSRFMAHVSWSFMLIVRNTFENFFAKAFETTQELLEREEVTNPTQTQVHIDTFVYVVLANQRNILERWIPSSECAIDVSSESIEIDSKIEQLKYCLENDHGRAIINVLKSNLCRDMQDLKLRVDFARSATELNPQNASWQQNLYLALRQLRRTTDFRQRPSEEEINACERAFDSIDGAVMMAKLYSELSRNCEKRGGGEHIEASRKAIEYTRTAMRLSPKSKVLKMRLVALLTSSSTYDKFINEFEALTLVKQCEDGICTSEVYHKIGKFYDTKHHRQHDSVKALDYFEKALESHIGNYPCLMDMFKNKIFQSKPTSEVIEKIDLIMESQHLMHHNCNLKFIKGFLLWHSSDQKAAFDLWLTAMEESSELKIDFVNLATFNACFVRERDFNTALTMMEDVKSYIARSDAANLEDRNVVKLRDAVTSIIDNFQRLTSLPSRQQPHNNRRRQKNSRWQHNSKYTERNWRK